MVQQRQQQRKQIQPRERQKKKAQGKRVQAVRRNPIKKSYSFSGFNFNFPWKALWLTLFIATPIALLVSGNYWMKDPQHLTIKSVVVTGYLKVLNKKLLQPVIEDFVKTNLHLLDTKGLEQAVEKNEWVNSASLTKVWPDKLIVKIREHKPVAFWGKSAMLSQQGEIIKAVLSEKKGELPLLYSPEKKGRNMAIEFLKIRDLMKDFPVKLVEFKEDARGSWKIKLENGLIVKIGRLEHVKRMKRFMVGYREKLGSVVDKIHTVDLRYTNGFAVKWKKGRSG